MYNAFVPLPVEARKTWFLLYNRHVVDRTTGFLRGRCAWGACARSTSMVSGHCKVEGWGAAADRGEAVEGARDGKEKRKSLRVTSEENPLRKKFLMDLVKSETHVLGMQDHEPASDGDRILFAYLNVISRPFSVFHPACLLFLFLIWSEILPLSPGFNQSELLLHDFSLFTQLPFYLVN